MLTPRQYQRYKEAIEALLAVAKRHTGYFAEGMVKAHESALELLDLAVANSKIEARIQDIERGETRH